MQSDQQPIVKDLVLIGGGHSHVSVLKRFGMKPLPGVRLTLICRDVDTPYSGMLPGHVAGLYDFDEVHIDLERLCRFAGARFYNAEAEGLDLTERLVRCRNRPPVAYDLLSINIGSTPRTRDVTGATGNVVPVKPINRFLSRWQDLTQRVVAQGGRGRIGVVGAGAGGVEILLAVRETLRRMLADRGHSGDGLEFHIFSADDEILATHNPRVRRKFEAVLADRGVHVHTRAPVTEVGPGRLESGSEEYRFDAILWVTAAGAPQWLGEAGLAVDDDGFIHVDQTLRSISHPEVFAAGDIASMEGEPRPKSGVFAVRQGKPLARNLRRALRGRTPRLFRPQRNFLSLITTGERNAVASRAGWPAFSGHWVWLWKDWIDRRFMRKFSDLPEMETESKTSYASGLANEEAIKEISAIAMRCGGCGAKVGSTVLTRALAELEPVPRKDILIGLHEPDDAAVVEVPPGKVMVHTVDSFRALIDDPYLFGKITVNHCLGDIFAMGAEPQTALAIVTIPYGIEEKVEATLRELLAGAAESLNAANTALVGGHTSEGAELSLGFAINGLVDRAKVMRKGGMKPGDRLILTKPVGTGTLFAADMRHRAKGRWIMGALDSMLQSNEQGAACLHRYAASACTDVTGFGVLGHLVEMVKPAGVDITLDLGAIPLLEGAADTVRDGIVSSLQPQNVRLRRAIRNLEEAGGDPRYPLLFDPQTAGGLLASVPGDKADACVSELRDIGYEKAAVIGSVNPAGNHLEPIVLRM